MSGRKLGRLRGSLLVLAAAALIGLFDVAGDARTDDLIWTDGDIIWTVNPVDPPVRGGI